MPQRSTGSADQRVPADAVSTRVAAARSHEKLDSGGKQKGQRQGDDQRSRQPIRRFVYHRKEDTLNRPNMANTQPIYATLGSMKKFG